MKVKFIGCSDLQVKWGKGSDPGKNLIIDHVYEVESIEMHSWHTLYQINGINYNSVCFEEVQE